MRNFERTDVREEASAKSGTYKNGISNRGLRPQLQSMRKFNKTLSETLGLEFMKRIARSSVRL
jgi:hypothetical protein